MKKRSRTEYSLINMLTGIAGYGIDTVMGFVCRVIFVRTLATDYLGVSGLFTNILSMLSLAELGIGSAITYALYKPLADNDENKITAIMQFYRKAYAAIGCFVAVIGLAVIPFLNLIITDPPNIRESIYLLYLLYLTNTVLSYFFSYRQSLLTASQRQYIVSGYNYVITISQSILQTVYLLVTHEYIGYLLIQIAGSITYNVWISTKVGKDYPYIKNQNVAPLSKQERRSLFRNIKALAINKVSGVLVNSTDNIAITYFIGLTSVGLSSNYTLLSSTVGKIIGLVFNALPGSIGNLNASEDESARYRFFNVLSLMNFWLFGWGAIGIALVSGDLVKWLFGAEYVLPMRIPIIIAINSYTIGMLQASYTYKSTLGLFRYGQYLLFFTGIINLALDVVLGRKFGVFGIYLATLIARTCTNLWYEPYAVYRYGLKKNPMLYWARYVKNAAILLFAGGTCWSLCSLCHFSAMGNAVVKFAICVVVPNALFWVCFRKSEEYSYLQSAFKRILGILFRKR